LVVCFERAIGVRKLISRSVVGAGMEVAGSASRTSVAAYLHIPEQSFTQYEQGLTIPDVAIEIGNGGNSDSL
jgi:hypothetical protein